LNACHASIPYFPAIAVTATAIPAINGVAIRPLDADTSLIQVLISGIDKALVPLRRPRTLKDKANSSNEISFWPTTDDTLLPLLFCFKGEVLVLLTCCFNQEVLVFLYAIQRSAAKLRSQPLRQFPANSTVLRNQIKEWRTSFLLIVKVKKDAKPSKCSRERGTEDDAEGAQEARR
jgi:hypothetical protein